MMPREAHRIAKQTATAPARSMLLGRDHTTPGAVATATVGAGVAIGITRGWKPKPYAYVDPNEDAVAAAADDRTHLLVVADGHNGHRASHVAVEAALEVMGDDLRPADLTDDEVVAAAGQIEDRVRRAAPGTGPRSRTTLVVALRTPWALQWFGAGDSALLVVDDGSARALPTHARWFFGDHAGPKTMRDTLARGRLALDRSAWVVAASDGYTDYLPVPLPPADATRMFLGGITRAHQAVDVLLDHARRGGAGDNVGVSLSGPW